ncbi:hypothetical protein [Anaerospora sp.]|uniref:hypothetical protein n=1 Tax=Anaerospora sp. TaxID=1960278 RepID=UPI00289CACFD|nr:hypothetical protein [Anaerospora sp.]
MTSRHNLMICILLCAIIFPTSLLFAMPAKNTASDTEAFIKTKLINPNGILATYLLPAGTANPNPDIVAGRDSLSESLGFWMQYAILKNDAVLFEQCYQSLIHYYLLPGNLVAWQVTAEGQKNVAANALVDDLRILDTLFQANELWPNPKWQDTAKEISLAVDEHLMRQGQLVDFYDHRSQTASGTLTLTYLYPPPIQKAAALTYFYPVVANRSLELLRTLPTATAFYPKTYDVTTGIFTFTDKVNMLDQMLIALNRQSLSIESPELIQFIKTEFYRNGKLMTDYDRVSHAAVSPYESPALYAVIILYAAQQGDPAFALDIYRRMICFRVSDGENRGGYMAGDNTHIFDNLLPLIAETVLQQKNFIK